MTPKEFDEILMKKKIEMGDEDNIFCPPTSDYEGLNILIKHFLGDNWYTVNPISHEQVNTEAIMEILCKYPNGEQKKERRRKRIADFLHDIIDCIFG